MIDILGALRSHDPDVVKSLDHLRFSVGPDDTQPGTSGRFVVDSPMEVGEEFADAVDVALATALGVTSERARRRRRAAPEPQVLEEARSLSEEDMFFMGVQELHALGRWDLLPRVPAVAQDFPLAAWWAEVKQRWGAGTLDSYDRQVIADSVSWLAHDLERCTTQRNEMARLTDAELPEQIAAQFKAEGIYADMPLAPILAGNQNPNELIEPITAIETALTHAAMPRDTRLTRVIDALKALAPVVASASDDEESYWWDPGARQRAVINGFVYALQSAATRDPRAQPRTPWSARQEPEAHQAGHDAAIPFTDEARRLQIYRFPDDIASVAERLQDEEHLDPDQRLDELGWEIYLLARARGATHAYGLEQATDTKATLRQRKRVRADLLRRARRTSR